MVQETASLSNMIVEYVFSTAEQAGGRSLVDRLIPAAKEAGGRFFADMIDGTYGDDNGNLIEVDSYYAQLGFVVLIIGMLGGLLALATGDLVSKNSPDFVGAISEGIEAIGLNNLFAKVDDVLGQGAGLANSAGASLAQAPYLAAQAAEDYLVKRVGLEGQESFNYSPMGAESMIKRRR